MSSLSKETEGGAIFISVIYWKLHQSAGPPLRSSPAPPALPVGLKPSTSPLFPPFSVTLGSSVSLGTLLVLYFHLSFNMTQVNGCLKWLLTIFNIIFAIVGGGVIVVALMCQFHIGDEVFSVEFNPSCLYIVGSIVLVIAILGAVGAYNESKACMVLFLVCMILGSIVMLTLGSMAAVQHFEMSHREAKYRGYLPLDKASRERQQEVNDMQTKNQCCGLFSHKDWEGHIPDSCLCSTLDETEGNCHTVDVAGVLQQKKSVYFKTCVPRTIHLNLFLNLIYMGIVFSLAALALLGMILSSIMIHQLRHPDRPVFLMTVPGFTKPPKYQELQDVLPAKYY